MGKTLTEKLLSKKSGGDAKAGDIVIASVDLVFAHDVGGPLTFKQIRESGFVKPANPGSTPLFLDHCVPSPRMEMANDQKFLRTFAEEFGCPVSQVGDGVCHQLVIEKWAKPGNIILGGDSHTCTAGGLGAFATGMGSTDIAVAMALGKTWFRVPETIFVKVTGKFPTGVYAKDLILHVIGILSAEGATYKVLEFGGDTTKTMTMSQRFTTANMAVEAGAKAALFSSDEVTKAYLDSLGRKAHFQSLFPDPDAVYEQSLEIEAEKLVPLVAKPHTVDNVVPVSEVEGKKIDQVFIGSCTNGRLEDFAEAAKILHGKHINPRIRLIVAPASRTVYLQAMEKGYIKAFIDAGAAVVNPGCAVCAGVHQGVLADVEVCVSTSNRNFKGRMGNPSSYVYLSSPATAAASAIYGAITSPEKLLS
jgi:3-isopropylmalate/(R)-2-methylmalate dehydratase large subunit